MCNSYINHTCGRSNHHFLTLCTCECVCVCEPYLLHQLCPYWFLNTTQPSTDGDIYICAGYVYPHVFLPCRQNLGFIYLICLSWRFAGHRLGYIAQSFHWLKLSWKPFILALCLERGTKYYNLSSTEHVQNICTLPRVQEGHLARRSICIETGNSLLAWALF